MSVIPRRTLLLIALVIVVAVVAGAAAGFAFISGGDDRAGVGSPVQVLLAAGDIAECDDRGDEATARIVAEFPNATIAALGDLAYQEGTRAQFEDCYDPSWGKFRSERDPQPATTITRRRTRKVTGATSARGAAPTTSTTTATTSALGTSSC